MKFQNATRGGNSLKQNPRISSVPRRTSSSVSFHVWTVPGVCPATRRQWADFLAALAVLLGSPKIVCRLRTRRVECSKLGKTQLIQDAGRGMVRNTGFYD